MASSQKKFTLFLFGSGGVGKTTIAERPAFQAVKDTYDPTLEESNGTVVRIDGEQYCVDVHDPAGHDEYIALRHQYMRAGDGFFLVYDITNHKSFEVIEDFHQQIVMARDSDSFPYVVCGNKCDLESERQVSREEGQRYAESKGCPFFEISAKEATNVNEAFTSLCRLVVNGTQRNKNDNDLQGLSGKKGQSKCIIC